MSTVVTYQLAYNSRRKVDVCAACVARNDHDLGALGPVEHGQHRGDCDGKAHREPGRPARSGEAGAPVTIRATAAERAAWERTAGDLSLSEWLRQLANAASGNV